MKPFIISIVYIFLFTLKANCTVVDSIYTISFRNDVLFTIDQPDHYTQSKTIIILYALPNGNTTAQTMGKKMLQGDDWHVDIQHIKAQTEFIRHSLHNKNIVVVYLENSVKSWPAWKTKHQDYPTMINKIVDTIASIIPGKNKSIYLNGHSGGGSFILAYLQSVSKIPSFVKRISFLDSNYGYDSTYTLKLVNWLKASRKNHLSVFAYNDSVVLYNGKPLVSPTGGTWYRSKLMQAHLSKHFKFSKVEDSLMISYISQKKNAMFFLKKDDEGKILHTAQVERNGFIHSVLSGTRFMEKGYKYYGERAYQSYIK